jgi:hypothetical protein
MYRQAVDVTPLKARDALPRHAGLPGDFGLEATRTLARAANRQSDPDVFPDDR